MCIICFRKCYHLRDRGHPCELSDLWPPNSPNLNPVDYKIWGNESTRKKVQDMNDLRQHFIDMWLGAKQSYATTDPCHISSRSVDIWENDGRKASFWPMTQDYLAYGTWPPKNNRKSRSCDAVVVDLETISSHSRVVWSPRHRLSYTVWANIVKSQKFSGCWAPPFGILVVYDKTRLSPSVLPCQIWLL